MSDQNAQAAWLTAWLSTQRELWQKFAAGAPGAPPPPALGPQAFMQLFGATLPDSSRDVTRRMMEFGEGYLGVAREFWKVLEGAPQAPQGSADLARQLEALRGQLMQGFSGVYGATAPAGLAPGSDALAAWSRLGAAFMPGAAPPEGAVAFGPTRERQEALERLARAGSRYQQALAAFGALLGRVSSDAVDRLARRIGERAAGEQRPESLRAIYDLWVDAGEEAYAAAAHAPEFARAQAELNDALMDLKREQQRQVEDWARSLDLPTRSEMNTVLKRVNTLRRRLRELEEELEQLRGSRQP
jgi:polyhydroxyalkanoate synthase subunit PhaE